MLALDAWRRGVARRHPLLAWIAAAVLLAFLVAAHVILVAPLLAWLARLAGVSAGGTWGDRDGMAYVAASAVAGLALGILVLRPSRSRARIERELAYLRERVESSQVLASIPAPAGTAPPGTDARLERIRVEARHELAELHKDIAMLEERLRALRPPSPPERIDL